MELPVTLRVIPLLALVLLISTGASSCDPSASKSSNSGAAVAVFTVTGSAPGGVDITYGSDGTNLQGRLPLDTTLAINKNALYYQVTAQLQGGGNISCSVTIGDQTRTGHATGGYNICSAQLNGDFNGGWG